MSKCPVCNNNFRANDFGFNAEKNCPYCRSDLYVADKDIQKSRLIFFTIIVIAPFILFNFTESILLVTILVAAPAIIYYENSLKYQVKKLGDSQQINRVKKID